MTMNVFILRCWRDISSPRKNRVDHQPELIQNDILKEFMVRNTYVTHQPQYVDHWGHHCLLLNQLPFNDLDLGLSCKSGGEHGANSPTPSPW